MIDTPEYNYLSLRNQSASVGLQQLRYAVVSAEYGSFRRAAEALLMRQSTLSRCIRQLEEAIGLTVFERSSGGICTTVAGRAFLRTARSILEQMDALVVAARNDGRGVAGNLLLASIHLFQPVTCVPRWRISGSAAHRYHLAWWSDRACALPVPSVSSGCLPGSFAGWFISYCGRQQCWLALIQVNEGVGISSPQFASNPIELTF